MSRGLVGKLGRRFWSNLARQNFSFWPAALIGIVVIKAVLSLDVNPGSFVLSYSGISYFLLLLLATGFALRNGIQNTLGGRPFWTFIAIGYGFWTLHQGLDLYYQLLLQIDVPDSSIADPALFLHIALMMAAVAIFRDQNLSDRKLYNTTLNAIVLLFIWSFLYGYLVFPYQYAPHATSYGLRFDALYLSENLILVLIALILAFRIQGPWKLIYFHLFGASTLYAFSSTLANLATDSGGYLNGKLYGLGLTASVCWFVWIPLRARLEKGEITTTRPDTSQRYRGSVWAMLVVVLVSIPIIWELFRRSENTALRDIRLLVAIVAILCLASAAYIKEYLAGRELDFHFGLANERLRLAMQASTSVAWDFEVKSERNVWFGDLQTIFGIPSGVYETAKDEFINYVHPDDRTKVSDAIEDARQNKKLYTAEFRVVRPDGNVRWLAARGEFLYARSGSAERMLGVSLDITERKLAEEALSGMSRRVIEAEERERDRIARDLHEDIGQRLALLAIAIEELRKDFPHQEIELLDRMDAVWTTSLQILADVKASAHELYSPRLEYLGIAAVMKTFCEEYGERKRVEIDFSSHDLPDFVPPEVSICLFRVLQESLRNAVMYSGVQKFSVELWGESDEIHLRVCDFGVGFDNLAASGSGLGLIRIEQRVKLIEGTFSIDSQLESGTTVHVRVPSMPSRDSIRAKL